MISEVINLIGEKMIRMYKEHRIYKPNKNKDGAASKLQLKLIKDENETAKNKRKIMLFWVICQQTGIDQNNNATFGWQDEEKYVTIKLGEIDVGKILTTLNLLTKETKIFHQNPKGNTTLTMSRTDKGYNLRISKQINKKVTAISHSIAPEEAEILKILLKQVIINIYQW